MSESSLSEAGVNLAKVVVEPYLAKSGIRAALVGGSVGRGCADEYSDLELGLFWDEMPSEVTRRDAIEMLGATILAFDRDGSRGREHLEVRSAAGFSGTSMISCIHGTVADTEREIRAVLNDLDTSMERQALLSALATGHPLHGASMLEDWQSTVRSYPTDLAIKIIQENLWFGPFYIPEAYITRGDVVVLYGHYQRAIECLLRILAALNRQYYPSEEYKWTPQIISSLALKPDDLLNRMREVWSVALEESWPLLRGLLLETIGLIEENLPQVNEKSLFEDRPDINTTWARKRLEPHPPYTLMGRMAGLNEGHG
jgi:hypothetical protein